MVRFRPGGVEYLDDEEDGDAEEGKSNTPSTPHLSACQSPPVRSSERIRQRQRTSFQKPTRDEVMSKIPTLRSPKKVLECLKPRQLVNDLMKVTNRYNHDPDYTSGESSIDDFIDDGDKDIAYLSYTSTEESTKNEQANYSSKPKKPIVYSDDDQSTDDKFNKDKVSEGSENDDEKFKISRRPRAKISSSDSDSERDKVEPRRKRIRTSRIVKTINAEDSSDSDSVQEPQESKIEKKSASDGSESDSSNGDSEDDDCENSDDGMEGILSPSRVGRRNGSPKYPGINSPRAAFMQQKRDEKKQMFTKLKQVRERRNRQGNASVG